MWKKRFNAGTHWFFSPIKVLIRKIFRSAWLMAKNFRLKQNFSLFVIFYLYLSTFPQFSYNILIFFLIILYLYTSAILHYIYCYLNGLMHSLINIFWYFNDLIQNLLQYSLCNFNLVHWDDFYFRYTHFSRMINSHKCKHRELLIMFSKYIDNENVVNFWTFLCYLLSSTYLQLNK